jgi:polar amino acid transport system permease protein
MSLDFTVVPPYAELLLIGLLWTVLITVLAGVISVVLGIVIAIVTLHAPKLISLPLRGIVFLFMGTPLLLQLVADRDHGACILDRCVRAWYALCRL